MEDRDFLPAVKIIFVYRHCLSNCSGMKSSTKPDLWTIFEITTHPPHAHTHIGRALISHFPINGPVIVWLTDLILFRLKAHFEVNPKDLGNEAHQLDIFVHIEISDFVWIIHVTYKFWRLACWTSVWSDLLKHDKVLSKKPTSSHLRDVPEYLLDPTTQEASKIVKLARAAMGNNNSARRKFKGKSRKDKDPLKSFSGVCCLAIPNFSPTFSALFVCKGKRRNHLLHLNGRFCEASSFLYSSFVVDDSATRWLTYCALVC